MIFRNKLLNGSMYTPPSVCFAEGDPPADPNADKGGGGGGNKPELPAWLGGAQLNEHQTALLTKKSWNKDTPVTVVLDSYINAEKALGGDRIALPKGAEDQAGWDGLYKAAGRPDKPEAYTFKLPDPADPQLAAGQKEFLDGFKSVAHKSGLGDKQAGALVEWWQAEAVKVANARNEKIQATMDAELVALKAEQGAAYEDFTKIGNAGAQALKLTAEDVDALEKAWGTKKTLTMLHQVGKGLKEGKFAGGDDPGTGQQAMTPEAAKARIAELKRDPEWQKKYRSGDPDAKRLWTALHGWGYPE